MQLSPTDLHRTIDTWEEFKEHWSQFLNFRMEGECKFPAYEFPPLPVVVDAVRNHPESRIWRGAKGTSLDKQDIAESFRALPLDEALNVNFQMSHFKLWNFYGSGQILEGFDTKVLNPWLDRLKAVGFKFERFYPIIFMSGKGCCTNFHIDPTNVVAWQIYGTKRFSGTKDPERWVSLETRMGWKNTRKPDDLTDDDTLVYEMKPGDMLWNAMLTPHWVDALDDEVALSINLAIDGLQLNGEYCPHERELRDYRIAQGEDPDVTNKPPGDY
jgi:hypothetical protein